MVSFSVLKVEVRPHSIGFHKVK